MELLLCKRRKTEVPDRQTCTEVMETLMRSRDQYDKKIAQYLSDYLTGDSMSAWDSFEALCKVARQVFPMQVLFDPFPTEPGAWNKKALAYMAGYADTDEETVRDFLATLIMSQSAVAPQAKSFYFKWLSKR